MSIARPYTNSTTQTTDSLRQVLWRFQQREDLHALVRLVREVARGPLAQLVASGARHTHEWTAEKNELLEILDRTGITTAFIGRDEESNDENCRNFARALIGFELAWVDAGAATSLLAGLLAFAPIGERGTPEQKHRYLCPAMPTLSEPRKPPRGAFCLTEPIPYAGTDASILGGKVGIAKWGEDLEPVLRVQKSGRYITNMAFADFVVAAVESNDIRIRGSCLIILEKDDPGLFDRGIPTPKLAHQLSSTSDPRFDLSVPAGRIVGGYSIQDGVIVPNFSHGDLIEPVLKRSRVIVGLLTSAKLLSAVEPLIRYHRGRFRGAEHSTPGTPRYRLGLQQHQDVGHRVVEIWAAGEAGASLGFAAARLFDVLGSMERRADAFLRERGIQGRGKARAYRAVVPDAIQCLETVQDVASPNSQHLPSGDDILVQFVLVQAEANLLAPAVKLWNTGVGAMMMREAVSLMGGFGVTEECPGFLGYKWIDAQLEATYEGPEALQRRSLAATVSQELFPALWKKWIGEMRALGTNRRRGGRVLAAGMELWFWTYDFLRNANSVGGAKLYRGQAQGITFPLVDALGWLIAARQFVLDVDELGKAVAGANDLAAFLCLYDDLCEVQAARAAGEAARICTDLVMGNRTDVTNIEGNVYPLDFEIEGFISVRARLDQCLAGSRVAKNRAADAVSTMTIPERPDYPR